MDALAGEASVLGGDDTEERRGSEHDAADAGRDAPAPPATDRRLLVAVLLAVNVPIMVAVTRALAHGWQPLGDNGVLVVRVRDVGTSHHPLLGSWTSASLALGRNVNNPGPLYFDAVAPAVKLLGPWVGAAIGVALINMAASSLAVVVGRRINGTPSMIGVAVGVVGLQWALGSELLFDTWQPNALVLPFFAFLVLVAVLATGDVAMAPWVVGLGSFVVQTHMSHVVLVGALTAGAALACWWTLRRRADGGGSVRWRRPLVWTALVAVLAWTQPLIEQFTGSGEGNLSRIAGAARAGGEPIGWRAATRLVAEITAVGPWFTRDAYAGAVPETAPGQPVTGIIGTATAAVVVAALLLALIVLGVWAALTGRRPLATMIGVAVVALGGAVVAVATSPRSAVGLASHQMRWLWPVAAFATAAAVTALVSAATSRSANQVVPVVVGTVVVVAVAVANLPGHRSASRGPVEMANSLQAAQDLTSNLGSLEGRGTILYDGSTLTFGEPYSGLTFAEMQDHAIPFVFEDEGWIRQFGEGRRHDGSADLRMWQVEGAGALDTPPGARRVGLAEGPSGPVAIFVEPID